MLSVEPGNQELLFSSSRFQVPNPYPPVQFEQPFYRRLGYAVWLVMLAMSLFFYRERAFFMDAGFQLFNLINEEAIQIYHYRFVTAIPQVLPFLLLKMKAPLWALAMGFSVAYLLFYLLVYHLLVHWLKNDALGWALIFLFTLISFDTFYHIQSEFYLGLSLLLLVFGIVLRYPRLQNGWLAPVLIPLMMTVGFSHKLSLIFFLFLWIFFGWKFKTLRHWRYLVFLGVFMAIAVVKSIYFTNWYEAAKQAAFQENLHKYLPDLLSLPSNLIFLKRCLLYYYLLPLILLIVSFFYFRRKKWMPLGMIWAFTSGFLLLYNISDPEAKYRFYSEVTYLPLILFAVVPFLFDVIPSWLVREGTWWGKLPAVFVIVMLLRFTTIAWNSQTFDRLFSWIETQTDQSAKYGTNRFLLKKEHAPMDTVMMEWGIPFTSMHLSAIASPDSAKTLLVLPDFQWFEDKMDQDRVFFSPFHKVIEVEKLNRRYYAPVNGKYVELK